MMPQSRNQSSRRDLPVLFYYMESGDWEKAIERAKRHPRDTKYWATLRTKSITGSFYGSDSTSSSKHVSSCKRLALHHACFKLRSAGATPASDKVNQDVFVEVCRFILLLIGLYPEAAGQRESKHGCLPLHLACFASCAPRSDSNNEMDESQSSSSSLMAAKGFGGGGVPKSPASAPLARPSVLSERVASDATTGTDNDGMSAVHASEQYTGTMKDKTIRNSLSPNHQVSVSMRPKNLSISAKREEMAVRVVNALLDAYPKGIRVDSEGGRLPLHTACAGRATPRVVSTLVTAYASAARHRNKDGFLPLHLAAHWGVSHPSVAIILLKAYPDATLGRNRWERTPLEEALCMAGENGRPYQDALVRALRRHPSYWTRPSSELLGVRPAGPGSHLVDVDESLPSNDSTTLEEQQRRYGSGFEETINENGESPVQGVINRFSPLGINRKSVSPNSEDANLSLYKLIEKRSWDLVVKRIHENPLEVEKELQTQTRGGFTAQTGMTALHYACERSPTLSVVQALVEAYPVACLTRTMPGGCLPLHVACTWGASPEVVVAILSADQGACKITDELGNVALHSACFSGAPLSIIEAILRVDPNAVLARNHQGSRPIDICKRLRHENRRWVMSALTLKKEEILAQHRRSRSSGTFSDIAKEAVLLNDTLGAPSRAVSFTGLKHEISGGSAELQEAAIEVSYDDQKKDDLVWI